MDPEVRRTMFSSHSAHIQANAEDAEYSSLVTWSQPWRPCSAGLKAHLVLCHEVAYTLFCVYMVFTAKYQPLLLSHCCILISNLDESRRKTTQVKHKLWDKHLPYVIIILCHAKNNSLLSQTGWIFGWKCLCDVVQQTAEAVYQGNLLPPFIWCEMATPSTAACIRQYVHLRRHLADLGGDWYEVPVHKSSTHVDG